MSERTTREVVRAKPPFGKSDYATCCVVGSRFAVGYKPKSLLSLGYR